MLALELQSNQKRQNIMNTIEENVVYEGQPYRAINPQSDTDDLAAKGRRLMLRNKRFGAGLVTPHLQIAPMNMLSSGWVIGIIAEV